MGGMDVDPITARCHSQALDGVIAPLLVVLPLLFTSGCKVMGEVVNRLTSRIIGWLAVDLAVVYHIVIGGFPG
jgi:Mn2+/Fe2+ NRAMP family transporter